MNHARKLALVSAAVLGLIGQAAAQSAPDATITLSGGSVAAGGAALSI